MLVEESLAGALQRLFCSNAPYRLDRNSNCNECNGLHDLMRRVAECAAFMVCAAVGMSMRDLDNSGQHHERNAQHPDPTDPGQPRMLS